MPLFSFVLDLVGLYSCMQMDVGDISVLCFIDCLSYGIFDCINSQSISYRKIWSTGAAQNLLILVIHSFLVGILLSANHRMLTYINWVLILNL